jgi:alkylation response protein AidB-like acyl-CoA dehydrogenase
LKEAGDLRLAVPTELGGLGRTLAQAALELRRLAYFSAPTALAMNKHVYWTGLAADLWRPGTSPSSGCRKVEGSVRRGTRRVRQ